MKKMILAILVGSTITVCAATNDSSRVPRDVLDLDSAETVTNTNWVGKVVSEALREVVIKTIAVIEHNYSQAPLPYLTDNVRAIWKSQARFEARPPAENLVGAPIIFLVVAKDDSLLSIRLQGNYISVTTKSGTAYFKETPNR